MALSEADYRKAGIQFIRKAYKEANEPANVNRTDLKAAFDAIDDWADTNQASFVAALPEPFKTASNAQQKALALAYVALVRTGVI